MKKFILALLLICFTSCYQNDGVTTSSGDTSFSSEIISTFSSLEETPSIENTSSEKSIENVSSSEDEKESSIIENNSSIEANLSSEEIISNIGDAGEDNDSLSWGDIIWM